LSKVMTAMDLPAAYESAAKHDTMVLAEQFIEGMELTAAILGETALPLVRIQTAGDL
jgi:D-alanine-D-alanine ligase